MPATSLPSLEFPGWVKQGLADEKNYFEKERKKRSKSKSMIDDTRPEKMMTTNFLKDNWK